jgi:DNA-binding CsgD family transcriptional regulator
LNTEKIESAASASPQESELKEIRLRCETLELKGQELHRCISILITHCREQRKEFHNQMVLDVEKGITPLLEYLRSISSSECSHHVIDTIEFIIHQFAWNPDPVPMEKMNQLTTRELIICQMIRSGKNSRQIASALGLAYETVIVHRKNIRKKLGLKNTKHNLASYVQHNAQTPVDS